MSAFQVVETAEVLIVLIEASDDEFGNIVGAGNGGILDGINQLRPMMFQKLENGDCLGGLDSICVLFGEYSGIAFTGDTFCAGLKNGVDFLLEDHGLGIGFGIVRVINCLEVCLDILQGMENALVVDSFGEDTSDDGAIILAQISDDRVRGAAFGAHGEQEGAGAGFSVHKARLRETRSERGFSELDDYRASGGQL